MTTMEGSVRPIEEIDPNFFPNGNTICVALKKMYSLSDSPYIRAEFSDISEGPSRSRSCLKANFSGSWLMESKCLPFKYGDTIMIGGAQIEEDVDADFDDAKYMLNFDGSEACQATHLTILNWKERILNQPGTRVTLATLSAGTLLRNNNNNDNVDDDESVDNNENGTSGLTSSSKKRKKPMTSGKSRKKQKKIDDSEYCYTRLSDIVLSLETVHVYGIVIDVNPPKPIYGKDWLQTFTITDNTGSSLKISCFREKKELLPNPSKHQIFRGHRVKLQRYNDQICGILTKQPPSSWDLLSGNCKDSSTSPISKSIPPSSRPIHDDIVQHLRDWTKSSILPMKYAQESKYIKRQCDITGSMFCDLIVKAIIRHKNTLFVWDGTDIQVQPSTMLLQNNQLDPFTKSIKTPEFGSIMSIYFPATSLSAQRSLQSVQISEWIKLRNVSVNSNDGEYTILFNSNSSLQQLGKDNYFVRNRIKDYAARMTREFRAKQFIRNPHDSILHPSGSAHSCCSSSSSSSSSLSMIRSRIQQTAPSSSILPISTSSSTIPFNSGSSSSSTHAGSSLALSASSASSSLSSSSTTTTTTTTASSSSSSSSSSPSHMIRKPIAVSQTLHETVNFTPIIQVANYAYPAMKFRIRAQVINYSPQHLENFTRLYCADCKEYTESLICPSCRSNEFVRYAWCFKLHVRDHTGDLNVLVTGEEGEHFMTGALPPVNLYTNNVTLKALELKLDQLLSPDAWLDCSISSYTTSSDSDKSYRLIDTTLINGFV